MRPSLKLMYQGFIKESIEADIQQDETNNIVPENEDRKKITNHEVNTLEERAKIENLKKVVKSADLKKDVVLQPHQERAVEKIVREPATLLYHGLGSGKTLSSIAAAERLGGNREVVVPASLRENYLKEVKKFVNRAKNYNIKSYNNAVSEGVNPAELTVFDEAHRAGRAGTQVSELPEKAQGKTVFLSGTPIRNEPTELLPIFNRLIEGRSKPYSRERFENEFIGTKIKGPGFWGSLIGQPGIKEKKIQNADLLKKLLQGRVDYHPAKGEYPSFANETVRVDMDDAQSRLYHGAMESNPVLAMKIRRNLPPNKKEAQMLNAFLTAIRQISNNPKAYDVTLKGSAMEHSPKLQRMYKDILHEAKKDKNFKAFIYSNYLDSGIVPLAEELRNSGIPVGLFTGQLNDAQRKQVVHDYNTGKTKVLLASGAGSEGLDLKGTKLVQLMEPHWNSARIEQVIGRAIRHQSHSHLSPEDRHVNIRYYFAHPKPGIMSSFFSSGSDIGADQYLHNLSMEKKKLIDQFLKVLQDVGSKPAQKAAADYAEGLPSKTNFGDITTLPIGKQIPFVNQEHNAIRAKKHYDIRFGPDDMFSWAVRKGLPAPGQKHLAVRQALHRGSYANFEGFLTGYGAGSVRTHDKGSVIVTKADPNHINFSVIHHKAPEFYSMIRLKDNPKNWLMVNTTPQSMVKFLGGKSMEEVGGVKPKYTLIPASKVDKVFDPKYTVQQKIDGASILFHLLSDRINAISYRTTKEGKPIIHSYRIFGPSGSINSVKIPKKYVGSILRGETYGVNKETGKAIAPQELGGLLNASVAKSLETQKNKGIEMRNMLFNVVRLGKKPVGEISHEQRMAMLKDIMKSMPAGIHLPEEASGEQARELWNRIESGQHPLTEEGIVAWPKGGGRPLKVKKTPEFDVWVRNVFPGEGELKGRGAGGFEYARSPKPDAPIVGRVGTGFNNEVRNQMLQTPEDWVGRMARVRAQNAFPSGALRAPSFIALHEDYPQI